MWDPDGRREEVEAVIDTGFTGSLALPTNQIERLKLKHHSTTRVWFADNSTKPMKRFTVSVTWDGEEKEVFVYEKEGRSLIGMSLLAGSRMTMEVEDGGLVTIETI